MDTEGMVEILANDLASVEKAQRMIEQLCEEPVIGHIYRRVKVAGIEKFGLFVEFLPGRQGLLHVSEIDVDPGTDLNEWDLEDEVDVKLIGVSSLASHTFAKIAP